MLKYSKCKYAYRGDEPREVDGTSYFGVTRQELLNRSNENSPLKHFIFDWDEDSSHYFSQDLNYILYGIGEGNITIGGQWNGEDLIVIAVLHKNNHAWFCDQAEIEFKFTQY
ncbi:TPA: hypothetical protein VA887_000346 [Streptococcus agalactiae]|nr:hypothetical protein [Streptococcus agalactiae]